MGQPQLTKRIPSLPLNSKYVVDTVRKPNDSEKL